MRRRRASLLGLGSLAIALAAVAVVRADDDVSGTYVMGGRETIWPWSARVDSTLWLARQTDGTYRVARTFSFKKDGVAGGTLVGTGRLSGRQLEVTFPRTAGLSGALTGAQPDQPPLKASYKLSGNDVSGWCEAPNRGGSVKKFRESGRKGDPQPWPVASDIPTPTTTGEPTTPTTGTPTTGTPTTGTPTTPTTGTPTTPGTLPPLAGDVRVDRPVSGKVVLAGSTIPLELVPQGAELTIEGPARRGSTGLEVTGPGAIRLTARHAGKTSPVVSIEAVTAEVVAVTVEGAIPIQDAPAPHFRRPVGAPTQATWEPAAILNNQPLRLSLEVAGRKSLSDPATVRVTASQGSVSFDAQVQVQDLARGSRVQVTSGRVLNGAVTVNQLELPWKVGGIDAGTTRLRVYTTLAPPVENPMPQYAPSVRPVTLCTKAHFELACTWANGATKNSGQGPDSICYQLDNSFRHHVAPQDWGSTPPAVPPYPRDARKPINYADLPGNVSNGQRSVSSIYYPPLEPTKDYQEYYHYSRNFGWYVLDNPEYTGGRCNQQASLICDIMGTVGIQARVYYIERVGAGKQTGRPMRRYYKSSRSTQSWNFHGVVEATLDGGVKWIYDGSGSHPPTRINGQTEALMAVPDGPFIGLWHPWSYEDTGEDVPRSDYPDSWRGVPLQAGERLP